MTDRDDFPAHVPAVRQALSGPLNDLRETVAGIAADLTGEGQRTHLTRVLVAQQVAGAAAVLLQWEIAEAIEAGGYTRSQVSQALGYSQATRWRERYPATDVLIAARRLADATGRQQEVTVDGFGLLASPLIPPDGPEAEHSGS